MSLCKHLLPGGGLGPLGGCCAITPSLLPGSPYYDNVRPLCYSDSDAVLLCFDVSRPETLDSASKKVRGGVGEAPQWRGGGRFGVPSR